MENTIGIRIALLRKQKELRQEDLAEMLQVSPQAVSKWENDQSCPDILLLPKLAKILGVSVDMLLTGEQEDQATVRFLAPEERKDIRNMLLRIEVDSSIGDKIRVNLPIGLIQIALETGMSMPQISGNSMLKDIDFGQVLELVRHGAVGNLVSVDSADGDTVRIFVE